MNQPVAPVQRQATVSAGHDAGRSEPGASASGRGGVSGIRGSGIGRRGGRSRLRGWPHPVLDQGPPDALRVAVERALRAASSAALRR